MEAAEEMGITLPRTCGNAEISPQGWEASTWGLTGAKKSNSFRRSSEAYAIGNKTKEADYTKSKMSRAISNLLMDHPDTEGQSRWQYSWIQVITLANQPPDAHPVATLLYPHHHGLKEEPWRWWKTLWTIFTTWKENPNSCRGRARLLRHQTTIFNRKMPPMARRSWVGTLMGAWTIPTAGRLYGSINAIRPWSSLWNSFNMMASRPKDKCCLEPLSVCAVSVLFLESGPFRDWSRQSGRREEMGVPQTRECEAEEDYRLHTWSRGREITKRDWEWWAGQELEC